MPRSPLALLACGLALSLPRATSAYFLLSQAHVTGTGSVGPMPVLGQGMSLSGDGNTLALGGYQDDNNKGATWVFARDNVTGTWTQQGSKLVGVGYVGSSQRGYSVALSEDGNTLASGAPGENSAMGDVFVFTRSNGVWTEQGGVLEGTGNTGNSYQGASVALSADGNTLASGGPGDNSSVGAVWVFTRSAGVWSQQGSKLVGSGSVGDANQGASVALSADGNTLAWGGYTDNTYRGAVWVFTRSGGVWSSQTNKLVGTGNVGAARQGFAVALSADGNTLASGGTYDDTARGAVWIFTRNGTTWSQQGAKIQRIDAIAFTSTYFGSSLAFGGPGSNLLAVGATGEISGRGNVFIQQREGTTWQPRGLGVVGYYEETAILNLGRRVGLSNDGRTLAIAGPGYNDSLGAAWMYEDFTNSPTTLAPSGHPTSKSGAPSRAPVAGVGNETRTPTSLGAAPLTSASAAGSVFGLELGGMMMLLVACVGFGVA